jgi:hypothetical protein
MLLMQREQMGLMARLRRSAGNSARALLGPSHYHLKLLSGASARAAAAQPCQTASPGTEQRRLVDLVSFLERKLPAVTWIFSGPALWLWAALVALAWLLAAIQQVHRGIQHRLDERIGSGRVGVEEDQFEASRLFLDDAVGRGVFELVIDEGFGGGLLQGVQVRRDQARGIRR